MTTFDVVVIGGGAAGSSAALVLGRARASVALVDAGHPSNAPSAGIGGLLGQDGRAPADFYADAVRELDRYPSIRRIATTATAIDAGPDTRWLVTLDDGSTLATDRVVLAPGMRYALPDIRGLEAKWGDSAFHCPFCHGWEHRDQPLAVLGGAVMTVERTQLLRRWSADVTLVVGAAPLGDEERAALARDGVPVVDGTIAALHGPGRSLESIELTDGRTLAVEGLLVPTPQEMHDLPLITGLGVETAPSGHVQIDHFGATSVPGIWAAGDITSPLANVARAIAEGAACGFGTVHDMLPGH